MSMHHNGGGPHYPPHQAYGYNQHHPPPHAYGPPQPYGPRHHAPHGYAPPHSPPYGTEDPYHQQYNEGYPPHKRHKANSMSSRHPSSQSYQVPPPLPPPPPPPPPPPTVHAYGAQYPPYAAQPPYQAHHPSVHTHVPPPPPGWIPPPPPGWRGPIPPPVPPAGYQPQQPPSQYHYPPPQQQQPQQPPPPPPARKPTNTQNQHQQWQHWQRNHSNHSHNQSYTPAPAPPPPAPSEKTYYPTHTPTASHITYYPGRGSSSNPPSEFTRQPHKPRNNAPLQTGPVNEYDGHDTEWDWENTEYFYGDEEEIDPDLSLGTTVWRPPKVSNKAMPSWYKDAESFSRNPPPPPGEHSKETVSRYTTKDGATEECRPYSETKAWATGKDDPVFRNLSLETAIIPIKDLIANRGHAAVPEDEMDLDEEEGEIRNTSENGDWTAMDSLEETPSFLHKPSSASTSTIGAAPHESQVKIHEMTPVVPTIEDPVKESVEAMGAVKEELNDDDDEPYSPPPVDRAQTKDETVMEGNEGMKDVKTESPTDARVNDLPTLTDGAIEDNIDRSAADSAKSESERATETARNELEKVSVFEIPVETISTHQEPISKTREETQEEVLARLGVTGSPKPPGHRKSPKKPHQLDNSKPNGTNDNMHSYDGNHSPADTSLPGLSQHTVPPPPPPPPPPPEPEVEALAMVEESDPWADVMGLDKGRGSPHSIRSNGTLAGSDFHAEDDNVITVDMNNTEPKIEGRPDDEEEEGEDAPVQEELVKEEAMASTLPPPAKSTRGQKRARKESKETVAEDITGNEDASKRSLRKRPSKQRK